MNPREEIAHLTEVLERANHQYYVLDAPEMEDYEYDRLLPDVENLRGLFFVTPCRQLTRVYNRLRQATISAPTFSDGHIVYKGDNR